MRLPLAFALLLTATPVAAQKPGSPPKDLDRYVESVMKRFGVPGVGLAIVKDGKVVLVKGYGVRKLGERTTVDAKTTFGIASNSKLFTATALGMLVEEGKLEWDKPVVTYLPDFALSDPFVTQHLTVRDLLVHRSGLSLGAGDLLWWPSTPRTRADMVQRLRYIPLSTSFRSAYAYDNVLYVVAGALVEKISGQTWEDFVQTRIVDKLGMTGTTVRSSDASKSPDWAVPHADIEGTIRVVAAYTGDDANPAAGINSSAEDMARWVRVQLDSGRVSPTERLFKPSLTRQLWSVVTPIPFGTPVPELAATKPMFLGYGLGVQVRDWRRHPMVTHTGGLAGYVSKVTMLPEEKLGVVVLTNQESGAAFNAITYRILDAYLGLQSPDYAAIYDRLQRKGDTEREAKERAARLSRDSTSGPSLSLPRYAGTYRDPWYGDVALKMEGDHLVMTFSQTPSFVGDLSHWQHDTFLVRWRDRENRADAFLTFALTPDGKVDQAKMVPASTSTDFSFDFQDLLLKPAAETP